MVYILRLLIEMWYNVMIWRYRSKFKDKKWHQENKTVKIIGLLSDNSETKSCKYEVKRPKLWENQWEILGKIKVMRFNLNWRELNSSSKHEDMKIKNQLESIR